MKNSKPIRPNWVDLIICPLTCYCHDDGDHHHQGDLDFLLSRMGMFWDVEVRFLNETSETSAGSQHSTPLTFLRSEKYSATLHDAHLKVARLDQESECAQ